MLNPYSMTGGETQIEMADGSRQALHNAIGGGWITASFYPAAGESAPLTWEVELSAGATPGAYVLRFEPLEGRLLSVVRR